ncbi:VanW family protein [Methylocapsa sp. S129]|uniref:VanW family protein n=1 Tax=Methylocapsa sp. S129 TaxID=1641869 RepID=UPI00131E319F|nr:VanW family protein [Methylocapsa sp. S129]
MMGPARRLLRRAAPEPLRLSVAALRRAWRDRLTGDASRMLGPDARRAPGDLNVALRIVQPIRKSVHWQGKLANLRLAAARLDGIIVEPDRLFSFWNILGRPSAANGFHIGRSIRADRLEANVGGGLCQISGLIYEMGLRAGMAIAERHPHTRDIYSEDARFTPLGLDATVVWGHKDLRLRNVLAEPIVFAFTVADDAIEGRILAPAPIVLAELAIDRRDDPSGHRRLVSVSRRFAAQSLQRVSQDEYLLAPESS